MLNLISLNTEGDNHYDKIFPFFAKQHPDVICMQEVFEVDLPQFAQKLGMDHRFLVCEAVTKDNPYRLAPKGNQGLAIFSRLPILQSGFDYYDTARAESTGDSAPNSGHRGFLWVEVEHDGQPMRIMTTHFTWSADGSVTDLQKADLASFLSKTSSFGPHILCGDFNAPRGRAIFDTIAAHYTDSIPPEVRTSLDRTIHRVGEKLPDFVVDGLFTRGFHAHNVQVICGVSDHCAVIGSIT